MQESLAMFSRTAFMFSSTFCVMGIRIFRRLFDSTYREPTTWPRDRNKYWLQVESNYSQDTSTLSDSRPTTKKHLGNLHFVQFVSPVPLFVHVSTNLANAYLFSRGIFFEVPVPSKVIYLSVFFENLHARQLLIANAPRQATQGDPEHT